MLAWLLTLFNIWKENKRKIKINKQKGNKQKKQNKKKFKKNVYDSLVLYLTKKWLNYFHFPYVS
jgi:hypothetical protein